MKKAIQEEKWKKLVKEQREKLFPKVKKYGFRELPIFMKKRCLGGEDLYSLIEEFSEFEREV